MQSNTKDKTITIASPGVSGVGWVVNILLELGIKTETHSHKETDWIERDGKYYPGTYARMRYMMPVLGRYDGFEFQKGVHVRWDHILPHPGLMKDKVILVVRDPRDSIYSFYRRSTSLHDLSYEEFLNWPNYITLCKESESWAFYFFLWLSCTENHVVKFEDLKSTPVQTISSALAYMGIERSQDEIVRAVEACSFEKASSDERQRRGGRGENGVFHSSLVKGWIKRGDPAAAVEAIERDSGWLMKVFGYETDIKSPRPRPDTLSFHMAMHPIMRTIHYPFRKVATPEELKNDRRVRETINFISEYSNKVRERLVDGAIQTHMYSQLNRYLCSYAQAYNHALSSQNA